MCLQRRKTQLVNKKGTLSSNRLCFKSEGYSKSCKKSNCIIGSKAKLVLPDQESRLYCQDIGFCFVAVNTWFQKVVFNYQLMSI